MYKYRENSVQRLYINNENVETNKNLNCLNKPYYGIIALPSFTLK